MLVLDANILMRAVLGKRTRVLLATYGERVDFVTPDVAFDDAWKRIPEILDRRKLDRAPFLSYLDSLTRVVRVIEPEEYAKFEKVARQRIERRDEEDWPIVATALHLTVRFGPRTRISLVAA